MCDIDKSQLTVPRNVCDNDRTQLTVARNVCDNDRTQLTVSINLKKQLGNVWDNDNDKLPGNNDIGQLLNPGMCGISRAVS
jgi:hypothetical protein